MARDISLRKFAAMAGISPATASRVFAAPELVAPETVKHVSELAHAVGFAPSTVARAAFGGAIRSIGVLFPGFNDPFFRRILQAIQHTLLEADYLPIFLEANPSAEKTLDRLLKHRVDALIFGSSDEHLNLSEFCRRRVARLPLVALDHARPGLWADSVLSDDFDGGFQAGRHLLQLGHTRFAMLTYGEGTNNCENRLGGFREALRQAKIELDDSFVIRPGKGPRTNGDDDRKSALLRLFHSPKRPTALFCGNDHLARMAYKCAAEAGLKIPGDLSVVGFGDIDFDERLEPSLTSIRQAPDRLGAEAARLAIRRIENPEASPQSVVVPVQLIVRRSTAQIPRQTTSQQKG